MAPPAVTRSDLLYGMDQIAAFLDITKRQALHLHEKGRLPTFKMGRTVCARRSALTRHFAEQERAAREPKLAIDPLSRLAGVDLPPLVAGHGAIAQRLGIRPRELSHLERQRGVPTYREDGRLVASEAALADYLTRKGEG